MPKISVVMPAYNAEKYIAEAIDSILGQTYEDFEFIIINDCSTDRTEQIILSYDDPRIVYLKNERNSGVAVTLNRGLAVAQGEYIARMDADDISLPKRFEKQITLLREDPSIAICGTGIIVFGKDVDSQKRLFSRDPDITKIELLFTPCVAHPTVLMRKGVLGTNNLEYPVDLEGSEDYGLWWEVAKYGNIVSLQECLLKYRVHPNQVTKNSDHRKPRFLKFVKKRMADVGIKVTDDEAACFFAYCCGKGHLFSEEELKLFIRILVQLWRNDELIFCAKKLKCTLKTILVGCIEENQNTSNKRKREIYKYLKHCGISMHITKCRYKVHRSLRK